MKTTLKLKIYRDRIYCWICLKLVNAMHGNTIVRADALRCLGNLQAAKVRAIPKKKDRRR